MDQSTAQDLFAQLQTFSQRVFAYMKLPTTGSGNGSETIKGPKGVVVHYTAGTLKSAVAWFCDPKQNSGVSAHLVVGRTRMAEFEPFLVDLPLVAQLPVTVVQCRTPKQGANHATWVNNLCWGIENEHMGVGPSLVANTTKPIAGAAPKRYWVPVDGRTWDTYTAPQVLANITLVAAYRALAGAQFNPAWVIGHENVETLATLNYAHDKRDPGPNFPLAIVRQAACADGVTMGMVAQPDELSAEDAGLNKAGQPIRLLERAKYLGPFFPAGGKLSALWPQALDGSLFLSASYPIAPRARAMLGLLGYFVGPNLSATEWAMAELDSVYIAQVALGLTADRVVGPVTLKALQNRVKDSYQAI